MEMKSNCQTTIRSIGLQKLKKHSTKGFRRLHKVEQLRSVELVQHPSALPSNITDFGVLCTDRRHQRDVEYTITLCPECHQLTPARDARDVGQCFAPVARLAMQRVRYGHWHRHALESEVPM